MSDAGYHAMSEPLADQTVDVNVTLVALAALRQAGADQFDPVGLHYLGVLARRASARQGSVKRILDDKLVLALAAFKERLERAQRDAQEAIKRFTPQYPEAAAELHRLFKTGDFKGVRQCIATLKTNGQHAPLGELARYIVQHSPEMMDGSFEVSSGLLSELKATQYFRNTWSKFNVEKRVTQALHQAPENAGPINSHMLVLRSLELMRDISPDYLNRFTSYVDVLLCLDQCNKDTRSGKHTPKKPLRVKREKKSQAVSVHRDDAL